VTWVPVAPGAVVAMGKERVLEAFAAVHTPGEPALGYRVVETRRRLKAEFADLLQSEIERRALQGLRHTMMEETRHIVFAHSGDAMAVSPDDVRGADLLVHDATFLVASDRREPIHASTEEALDAARQAGVRTLILHHLSVRYERPAAFAVLQKQVAASGYGGKAWLLDEGALVKLH
jgi:ribonuclease Z